MISSNLVTLGDFYSEAVSTFVDHSGESFETVHLDFLEFQARYNENRAERQYFTESYDLGSNLLFVIYFLISRCRCESFLESGVAAGKSTSFILRVQDYFMRGKLISIDITSKVGDLIPIELIPKFNLQVLPRINRQEAFVEIIQNYAPFEIFLHDSDHSIEYQLFELESVLEANLGIQWLLIDDINQETLDFLKPHPKIRNVWITNEGHKFSGVAQIVRI
jgi:hypothetical protein